MIKLSYKASSDVLVHTGDIVAKGPLDGSLAVLSYMTRNKVQGVRGNHDQKVIEWRGWLEWVRSLPGGKKWLDETHSKWAEAQAKGERIESWIKKEKKKDKKWWTKLPEGWTLFGDHYNIARAMSESQFSYLLALPLKIHVPSAHVFIVHAGLLASDPRYSSYNSRQPLTRIPTIPSEKGGTSGGQDTESLRHLQEVAILNEVPQNRDPWAVLNMRGVKKGQVVRHACLQQRSSTPVILTCLIIGRKKGHRGLICGTRTSLTVRDLAQLPISRRRRRTLLSLATLLQLSTVTQHPEVSMLSGGPWGLIRAVLVLLFCQPG